MILDQRQDLIVQTIKDQKLDSDYKDILHPGQLRLPNGRKVRPIKVLDKKEYNHIL